MRAKINMEVVDEGMETENKKEENTNYGINNHSRNKVTLLLRFQKHFFLFSSLCSITYVCLLGFMAYQPL